MKHLLKGVAVVVVVMSISMVINVYCNINGIDVDTTANTIISSMSAMLLYEGLIKREKNGCGGKDYQPDEGSGARN